MYNKLLNTFLSAAELGSFSKAAVKMHISSTAVVKQINQLEDELDVTLFIRTSRGVELTEAGRAFQDESRKLIEASRDAVRRVRQIESRSGGQVRLGTSMLRPARFFLHRWAKVYGRPLNHRVVITPFLDNSFTDYLRTVNNLGKEIDVIATAYPPGLSRYHCSALEVERLPFCLAVSEGHPLVKKKMLQVSDLRGTKVMILAEGLSAAVDEARRALQKCGDITLLDTLDYEPALFNQCASSDQALLTLECWNDVHPMLTTIPINWSLGTFYGLLYSREPSADTRAFIDFVRRHLK